MEIEIINWDKYNPRKDLKTLTWLRLDSDIGFSESLFNLSAEAKWLWIFLLSFSAKKNTGILTLDKNYISYHSSVPKERIADILKCFVEKGLIEIKSTTSRIRTDSIENVSYERTNDTNITNDTDTATEAVTPDFVIDLFNGTIAEVGKVKKYPSYSMSPNMITSFRLMLGYLDFQTQEQWHVYFKSVAKCFYLTSKGTCTLPWILIPDNAFKVLAGQYQDQDQDVKINLKGNQDAQTMSSKLFDGVIKAGSHGLKEYLAKLNQHEKVAIDNFGRASEILSCNDFEATAIKKRLREACEVALQDKAG